VYRFCGKYLDWNFSKVIFLVFYILKSILFYAFLFFTLSVMSRLQNGEPYQIYVGVHSFGAWYTWDRANRWFYFDHGEPLHRNNRRRGRV
jgi:hypothetical protein